MRQDELVRFNIGNFGGPLSASTRLLSVGRFAGLLMAILIVWFFVLAFVPLIHDAPGQYLVIGPQKGRLAAIGETPAKLVSEGWGYTKIASSSPNVVKQLYAQGGWIILPASNGGCLSLTEWRRLTES